MNLRNVVRPILERHPPSYLTLLKVKRWRHWSSEWVVTKLHDAVIEGFPRSANSFAHSAFREANNLELRIGTHTHSPAQVLQAVKWRIPTMVLLREPVEAVVGLLAMNRQLQQIEGRTISAPSTREIKTVANRWLFFYSQIEQARNQIFIARFDQVISDYSAVSSRFVEFSNRPWQPYDSTTIPEENILGKSFHIGPNAEREKIKKMVKGIVTDSSDKIGFSKLSELYINLGYD